MLLAGAIKRKSQHSDTSTEAEFTPKQPKQDPAPPVPTPSPARPVPATLATVSTSPAPSTSAPAPVVIPISLPPVVAVTAKSKIQSLLGDYGDDDEADDPLNDEFV